MLWCSGTISWTNALTLNSTERAMTIPLVYIAYLQLSLSCLSWTGQSLEHCMCPVLCSSGWLSSLNLGTCRRNRWFYTDYWMHSLEGLVNWCGAKRNAKTLTSDWSTVAKKIIIWMPVTNYQTQIQYHDCIRGSMKHPHTHSSVLSLTAPQIS